jgi:hypothetical protein
MEFLIIYLIIGLVYGIAFTFNSKEQNFGKLITGIIVVIPLWPLFLIITLKGMIDFQNKKNPICAYCGKVLQPGSQIAHLSTCQKNPTFAYTAELKHKNQELAKRLLFWKFKFIFNKSGWRGSNISSIEYDLWDFITIGKQYESFGYLSKEDAKDLAEIQVQADGWWIFDGDRQAQIQIMYNLNLPDGFGMKFVTTKDWIKLYTSYLSENGRNKGHQGNIK